MDLSDGSLFFCLILCSIFPYFLVRFFGRIWGVLAVCFPLLRCMEHTINSSDDAEHISRLRRTEKQTR